MMPRGIRAPSWWNRSGERRNSIVSVSSSFASSTPATSSRTHGGRDGRRGVGRVGLAAAGQDRPHGRAALAGHRAAAHRSHQHEQHQYDERHGDRPADEHAQDIAGPARGGNAARGGLGLGGQQLAVSEGLQCSDRLGDTRGELDLDGLTVRRLRDQGLCRRVAWRNADRDDLASLHVALQLKERPGLGIGEQRAGSRLRRGGLGAQRRQGQDREHEEDSDRGEEGGERGAATVGRGEAREVPAQSLQEHEAHRCVTDRPEPDPSGETSDLGVCDCEGRPRKRAGRSLGCTRAVQERRDVRRPRRVGRIPHFGDPPSGYPRIADSCQPSISGYNNRWPGRGPSQRQWVRRDAPVTRRITVRDVQLWMCRRIRYRRAPRTHREPSRSCVTGASHAGAISRHPGRRRT